MVLRKEMDQKEQMGRQPIRVQVRLFLQKAQRVQRPQREQMAQREQLGQIQ